MSELTDRQIVIMDLICEGLLQKQIAHLLGISEQTVKWHLTQARRKLGARNTMNAAAIFMRHRRLVLA